VSVLVGHGDYVGARGFDFGATSRHPLTGNPDLPFDLLRETERRDKHQ